MKFMLMEFVWSMSEFKYLGCVLDEPVMDGAECKGGEQEEDCRCHQVPG